MSIDQIPVEDADQDNTLSELVLSALFKLDNRTQSDSGIDYKALYYGLFNGITLIIEHADTEQIVAALKHLQCMAETAFIGSA